MITHSSRIAKAAVIAAATATEAAMITVNRKRIALPGSVML